MAGEFHNQILSNVGYGFLLGILLLAVESLLKGIGWSNIGWYLLLGYFMILFGRAAESVWYSMFASMMRQPFSWFALLSKVTFWYMAGGIGYVVGLMVMKKLGWISVNEFPVASLFDTGATVCCFVQIFVQGNIYRQRKLHLQEEK
jgi:hypothetical protein